MVCQKAGSKPPESLFRGDPDGRSGAIKRAPLVCLKRVVVTRCLIRDVYPGQDRPVGCRGVGVKSAPEKLKVSLNERHR